MELKGYILAGQLLVDLGESLCALLDRLLVTLGLEVTTSVEENTPSGEHRVHPVLQSTEKSNFHQDTTNRPTRAFPPTP